MTVTLRFWANLKDITGEAELTRSYPEGSNVQFALDEIYQTYPRLKEWDRSLLLSIGHEYTSRSQILQDGDELSLMPPVQGG
ncbi:MoaD/ThiS family protein [Kamptonema cortianum]|uniref:Molybdopterin synthase sulfur carrier subunit n=1 Tax=Geitlerinema calcuttense NRMC-F 0142 TaxID=2922238 RepID=A0ABT7LX94_9CYAN|nr:MULTISPECIES: MoaD/ThiS family protein [Cyanophyceae]MDK3156674.1 MoaD/ThiS family protein [Kamptonema cortianum]MDL5050317.1 MoaD/ThiS family protein [Oscillatoria amoena NRMC-F 0135]MDL5053411.1 MoaD/ThiS family protein [Oscillatoria laete-virens NRMC-F 0139]MDL5056629.1 MoaD/ThiS family protein [Geitlerinema calcuttense NRMC-F 0142]